LSIQDSPYSSPGAAASEYAALAGQPKLAEAFSLVYDWKTRKKETSESPFNVVAVCHIAGRESHDHVPFLWQPVVSGPTCWTQWPDLLSGWKNKGMCSFFSRSTVQLQQTSTCCSSVRGRILIYLENLV
jgi:hypothetical protein